MERDWGEPGVENEFLKRTVGEVQKGKVLPSIQALPFLPSRPAKPNP